MAIEHVNIPEAELHEPKGVSVATSGKAYITDGAGSGNHETVISPTSLSGDIRKVFVANGASGGSWKLPTRMGWDAYNDVATTGTPIVLSSAGTFFKMTNDGLGVRTDSTFSLPEVTKTWNAATNQFDFSELQIGDVITLRVDFDVTTTGANHEITARFDFGIGGFPFSLNLGELELKSAATRTVVRSLNVFIGDANMRDNPAEFVVASDTGTTDSVVINGWFIEVVSRGED